MPKSVSLNVHGYRIELTNRGETWIKDSDFLYFGTDLDFSVGWDGAQLEFLPLTDDTGLIAFGDGTKDVDVKIYLGATTAYFEFNVGDGRLFVEGAEIRFGDGDKLEFGDDGDGSIYESSQHLLIMTLSDTKNVRINSRDYVATSGDLTGVQIKPSVTVGGTTGICGLEVSPRFQAGIAGSSVVAIKADPLLKAGSGNLSGGVVAVQANIDFGISGTRVISGDVSAFESFLAIPSTYTYSGAISFLRVRDVNIKGWDYFLNLDSSGIGFLGTQKTGGAPVYLQVLIGSTVYSIACDTT